jgi:hypothetical protein
MSNFNHWTSDQIERQKSFYEGIRDHAKRAGQPGASTVAAWMKEVAGGLYSFVYKLCEDLKIIDEAADNVASSVVEHFREFGQGRARRTALRPGGVGRR